MFDVVLHEPEIPNNTGNIGRTCVAAGCRLRLIEPIGFDISDKACRRAGLDYWPRLDLDLHDSFESYVDAANEPRLWLLSGRRGRLVYDADIRPGDHLVFGKETAGLPDAVLDAHPDRVVTLPMMPGERSLNLATAVCAVVYEGLRQCISRGEIRVSEGGRLPGDSSINTGM